MNSLISIIGYVIAVVLLAALIGGAAIRTNSRYKGKKKQVKPD